MKKAALCVLVMLLVVTAATADELMMVSDGTLRLRTEPDFNADVAGRYAEGTVVTVTGQDGAWKSVITPDGARGYMYGTYLRPVAEMQTSPARVVSGNGGNVNLRSAPGMGAAVITSVPVGTEVAVLSASGEWRYITLPDGRSGYMMSRFLAEENGGIRYVTSTNGGGVHMRSGPSQQYRSLGVLRVGTLVTLLETGTTWHRISYGGHEGYMMARYLTATAPPTAAPVIRSVRLSDLYPAIGDMLEAYATPTDAQCLFIWSDDAGRLLGTGSRYQVKTDDAGQRIRVTVTGFGTTSGAAVSNSTAAVAR